MERSEMIQKLNEAALILREMNVPVKLTESVTLPVFAALQRICEVGEVLQKQEETDHANDQNKQGD